MNIQKEKKIIVFNVGSSSCKFQIFKQNLDLLGKGMVEKINIPGTNISYKDASGKISKVTKDIKFDQLDKFILNFLEKYTNILLEDVYLMVHRVVNGGNLFKEDILIKDEHLIDDLVSLNSLAPLHNPFNNSMIISMRKKCPWSQQVVVFDTSFHSTIPKENYLYALPYKFYTNNKIRKYGAHGSSHAYITQTMKKYLKKDDINIINVHLGNGSSVCVIKNSKSLNTSMGFTPLAGLVMGTRSGDVDPSIIFHLINREGMDPNDVENIFIKESGLLGISGVSSDMRDIIQAASEGNERSILAREITSKRVADVISMYLSEVDYIDGITFTGGIGENDEEMIRMIISKLRIIKIILKNKLDNSENVNLLTEEKSPMSVYIVPTNEELYMAQIGKLKIGEKYE